MLVASRARPRHLFSFQHQSPKTCHFLTSPSPFPSLRANYTTESGTKSTLDQKEVNKFATLSSKWWDHKGEMAPLHSINPIRLSYIRDVLTRLLGLDPHEPHPFKGLKILDVGCGCGLVSEPLARLGGEVVGLDACQENIEVAKAHSSSDPSLSSLTYLHSTIEQQVEKGEKYSVVVALEVIEHVNNVDQFILSASSLLKKDGVLIISTINQTQKAKFLGVFLAENVLSWVPKGTHDWNKFQPPANLIHLLKQSSMEEREMMGMVFDPSKILSSFGVPLSLPSFLCSPSAPASSGTKTITQQTPWSLSPSDLDVNYFLVATKV